MRTRFALLVVVLCTALLPDCASAGKPAYERYLRRFAESDGELTGLSKSAATEVKQRSNTFVAISDTRLTPVCDGKDQFIIFADHPATGEWLGGDPGCRVLNLSVTNSLNELVFNPFCRWSSMVVDDNCLELSEHRTTSKAMRSQLRPVTLNEIIALLAPSIDGDLNLLPPESELKRFYVIKEGAREKAFVIAPLFGREAISIIIPPGVRLSGGQIGHNQLYIGGHYRYGDPLCQAVKLHGLNALPIKFSGPELDYVRACETT